jgi:hypothetical protein
MRRRIHVKPYEEEDTCRNRYDSTAVPNNNSGLRAYTAQGSDPQRREGRKRERERERALLGFSYTGESKASPAHGLRIFTDTA